MYWTTREGKKLKISEMETSHIKNCIALMKRKFTRAINMAMNTGEDFDEFSCPHLSYVCTLYDALVEEYNKRIQEAENGKDSRNYKR